MLLLSKRMSLVLHMQGEPARKGRCKQVSAEGASSPRVLAPHSHTAALKLASSLSKHRKNASLNVTYLLMAVGEPQGVSHRT